MLKYMVLKLVTLGTKWYVCYYISFMGVSCILSLKHVCKSQKNQSFVGNKLQTLDVKVVNSLIIENVFGLLCTIL